MMEMMRIHVVDGMSMIDWDKMPEFQTQRPVLTIQKDSRQSQQKKISSSLRSDGTTTREPTYVDFLADYDDDEKTNYFHIPNRLGIYVYTTQCWGDESKWVCCQGKME
jgi:hypothetical protein